LTQLFPDFAATGKNLLEEFEAEEMQDPADADAWHWEEKAEEKGIDETELT